MKFTPQNVSVDVTELKATIAELDAAIEKNTRQKELCEQLLAVEEGRSAPSRARRPRRGKTLRQTIHDVLGEEGGSLRAGVIRDRVLAAGYNTTATPHSFYTAVYNTANADPDVLRNGKGFRLRAKRKKKGA